MQLQRIDLLMIQETHIGDERKEQYKNSKFSWFFSGGGLEDKGRTCHHGVCIVIRNELRNYILDIETISARFISVKTRGRIPITFLSAYAPTADTDTPEKDSVYEKLTTIANQHKKKGILIVGADMNAKLLQAGEGPEEGVGPHIFGEGHTLREGKGVEDNSDTVLDFLTQTQTTLTNTLFQKLPQHLITYKLDKTAGNQPPYTNGRYDVIDYTIAHKTWINTYSNMFTATRLQDWTQTTFH